MLDFYDFLGDVWLCHSEGGICYNHTAFVSSKCVFQTLTDEGRHTGSKESPLLSHLRNPVRYRLSYSVFVGIRVCLTCCRPFLTAFSGFLLLWGLFFIVCDILIYGFEYIFLEKDRYSKNCRTFKFVDLILLEIFSNQQATL